jgi:fatty acid desaturase
LLGREPTDDSRAQTHGSSSAVVGTTITVAIAIAVWTGSIDAPIRPRCAVCMGGVATVIAVFTGASLRIGGHDRAHG